MGYYCFIHRCGFSRPDPKSHELRSRVMKKNDRILGWKNFPLLLYDIKMTVDYFNFGAVPDNEYY